MRELLRPFILFTFIIVAGLLLLAYVHREVRSVLADEAMVLAFALTKSVYFIWEMFQRIARTASQEMTHRQMFAMVGFYAIIFVASFAFDHLALLQVDPNALKHATTAGPYWKQVADVLYFSVSTFTTAGFGDILPMSLAARALSVAELMISFFLTVLVIANFAGLREHYRNRRMDRAS